MVIAHLFAQIAVDPLLLKIMEDLKINFIYSYLIILEASYLHVQPIQSTLTGLAQPQKLSTRITPAWQRMVLTSERHNLHLTSMVKDSPDGVSSNRNPYPLNRKTTNALIPPLWGGGPRSGGGGIPDCSKRRTTGINLPPWLRQSPPTGEIKRDFYDYEINDS